MRQMQTAEKNINIAFFTEQSFLLLVISSSALFLGLMPSFKKLISYTQ